MSKKFLLILLSLMIVISSYAKKNKHSKTAAHKSYKGLVMAGYQGWHDTPTDGANRGWGHYLQKGDFGPGNLKIDIWPELSEYKIMYPTPFFHKDSSVAMLPSDHDYATTDLRFNWMKDYGVDGVFMQRFIGNTRLGNQNTDLIGFYTTSGAAQATTSGSAATFVVNSGTAVNTGSTFDGYTVGQVVRAIRNTGLLA
jgi:hypothetical protein